MKLGQRFIRDEIMIRDKKTYLFLLKLKEYIDRLNSGNNVIVVEGYRDREALINIGVKANIICFSIIGKSFPERIEKILEIAGDKEIIVLTDFDDMGIELNKNICSMIGERGGRISTLYRVKLKNILHEKNIIHIEDLNRYAYYINILSLKTS